MTDAVDLGYKLNEALSRYLDNRDHDEYLVQMLWDNKAGIISHLLAGSAPAQCAPTWNEKTVEFAASMIVGSSINGADFDPDCCECPTCEAQREEVREMVRKILALSSTERCEPFKPHENCNCLMCIAEGGEK